ncbi:MAG: hypothetical protein J6J86_09705 [Lachnospiraceae bacterium]|nr:hypothetical protein [Lachnospiraceae bacterium]
MRNNEIKIYKSCKIQKHPKGKWALNGKEVASYEEAKRIVDMEDAAEKALADIDNYIAESERQRIDMEDFYAEVCCEWQ